MEPKEINKGGWVYRAFKAYIYFMHEVVWYRHTYRLNLENIPKPGVPLVVVANHQHTINDALNAVFSMRDRKPWVIARADAFNGYLVNKFMRGIGMLPAYRMGWYGVDGLANNASTFEDSELALCHGDTVVIYPEAGHQLTRWLGTYYDGYVKMAMGAAKRMDFKEDVYILPSTYHYNKFHGIQLDGMVKYGEPMSIRPWYELYQTKPRTACRQINAIIKQKVHDLMLCIDDVDNNDSIEFLRNNFREDHAAKRNMPVKILPEQHLVDKDLVASLDKAKEAEPEKVASLYQKALELKEAVAKAKTNVSQFIKKPNLFLDILMTVGLIALLPLWIVSLWPNGPMYWISGYMSKKKGDPNWHASLVFAPNVVVSAPLLTLITFILLGVFLSWWIGLIYVLLTPLITLFAWYYTIWAEHVIADYAYHRVKNKPLGQQIKSLINDIKNSLNTLL